MKITKTNAAMLGLTAALVAGIGGLSAYAADLKCLTPQELVQIIGEENDLDAVPGKFVKLDPDLWPKLLEITGFPFPERVAAVTVFYSDLAEMVGVMPLSANGCMMDEISGAPAPEENWKTVLMETIPTFIFNGLLEQIQGSSPEPEPEAL